jgi:hypothetical protein
MKRIERGRILGWWLGSSKATIRLRDGRVLDLMGPDEIGDSLRAGEPVLVEMDPDGTPLGWRRLCDETA